MDNPMYRYANGNYDVAIYDDGTVVREAEHDDPLEPVWPEAFDIKITNYCDAGCAWCHEGSTTKGKHSASRLLDNEDRQGMWNKMRGDLPKGVEIAIGGGNPLDHPELLPWVRLLREQGYVPSMTVNSQHLLPYKEKLAQVRPYLFGLGVSYNPFHLDRINAIADDNTIVHFILGVHSVGEIRHALTRLKTKKILLLGYKSIRRGSSYRLDAEYGESRVDRELGQSKFFVESLFDDMRALSRMGAHIAFDTLAVEQMGMKAFVPPDMWESSYMGDDGEFTFFVDCVASNFAKSSSSTKRYPLGWKTIREMFEEIKNEELRT